MCRTSCCTPGTPDDVREYCKKMIDTFKDGGLIMDTAVMLDEAKPENLKAMMDFTKEYGVYWESGSGNWGSGTG